MAAVPENQTQKEAFANYLTRLRLEKDINFTGVDIFKADRFKNLVDTTRVDDNGFPSRPAKPSDVPKPGELKCCIIGAGISGLYAAYVLKLLGIPYEILEASGRVGGRVYTHYFEDERGDPKGNHQYYDIGCMRFPDTQPMARTFDLFYRMGLNKPKLRKPKDDNKAPLPVEGFDDNGVPTEGYEKSGLMPYFLRGRNQPTRYNDKTAILPDKDEGKDKPFDPKVDDPFNVSIANGGPVPNYSVKDFQSIMDDAYGWYISKILKDPSKGFDYLFKHDRYTLREYLQSVEDQDPETIHWLETLNTATGWFDEAFTENVLEEMAFAYPGIISWWCVDGGSSVVVDRMIGKDQLNLDVSKTINKRVVSISYNPEAKQEDEKMVVQVEGEDAPRKYATVINTTTLGALQKMELTGLPLMYSFKTAIRSLRYDTSTKVGIVFKEAWWEKDPYDINCAGLGKTDMPLRVCVYPSYNIHDPKDKNTVLLCSYTWGQDSERVAALVNLDSPNNETKLKNFMIHNLAHLHNKDNTVEGYTALYKKLQDLYVTHHAYDWSKNEDACSAFALFGPAQFSVHYPYLIRPAADGRFHLAGEATSSHHAWVTGSLNSALRAVRLFLERFRQDDLIEKLESQPNMFGDEKPFEFGKTEEVDYDTAHLQVAMGMLDPKEWPKPTQYPMVWKPSKSV